jgi:hypothetical protein
MTGGLTPRRAGLHKSMTNGEDGKAYYRPLLPGKSPINPRARLVHSQVQSRIRRERRRASGEDRLRTRRRRELGPSELRPQLPRSPGGLWGWFLALAAMLGGNRRPWDERQRKRERRRAVMSASKAARPGREQVRRPGIFQRKTG